MRAAHLFIYFCSDFNSVELISSSSHFINRQRSSTQLGMWCMEKSNETKIAGISFKMVFFFPFPHYHFSARVADIQFQTQCTLSPVAPDDMKTYRMCMCGTCECLCEVKIWSRIHPLTTATECWFLSFNFICRTWFLIIWWRLWLNYYLKHQRKCHPPCSVLFINIVTAFEW